MRDKEPVWLDGKLKCSHCGQRKLPEEFSPAGGRLDAPRAFRARLDRSYICKVCHRQENQATYARYREHYILNQKRRQKGLPPLSNPATRRQHSG